LDQKFEVLKWDFSSEFAALTRAWIQQTARVHLEEQLTAQFTVQ